MASVTTLPGAQPEHRDLSHWMDRVLKQLDNLRESPDKDAVHDLRVAVRRCRSVGAVLQEVDPDPAWGQMRRVPKKLFRKLGELRDTQIMDEWVKDHGAENDPLRLALQDFFQTKEPQLVDEALDIASKFDAKAWRRIDRKLRKRARVVAAGSPAAECLAVERLEDARELHAKALRLEKPEAWHALRIGVKKLRYTIENLLPDLYVKWSENLKNLQDLLGEVHDLDVLSEIIRQKTAPGSQYLQEEWERTIQRERSERIEAYREATAGKTGVWNEWRHALPRGKRLQQAALARLRSTARASDAHPRRTAQISRLSIALFDALGRADTAEAFGERSMRRILRAASRLSGLALKGSSNPRQKAACRFLLDLPVPPSWANEEWELLAWTVRYHRGAEPKVKNNAFARLSAEQQRNVRALAGLIRLARGLRKCGVETCVGLRAENAEEAVVLHVPGLVDSIDNAARVAKAKHLLETSFGKPVIVKTIQPAEKVVPLPQEPQLRVAAAASD